MNRKTVDRIISGLTYCAFAALGTLLLIGLPGCDTNAGRDFKQAKAAYVECVEARGAPACEGQRHVMDATSNVYALSSVRR